MPSIKTTDNNKRAKKAHTQYGYTSRCPKSMNKFESAEEKKTLSIKMRRRKEWKMCTTTKQIVGMKSRANMKYFKSIVSCPCIFNVYDVTHFPNKCFILFFFLFFFNVVYDFEVSSYTHSSTYLNKFNWHIDTRANYHFLKCQNVIHPHRFH